MFPQLSVPFSDLTPGQLLQVKYLMRAIWSKYSDEFGYGSEKLATVDAVDRFEDANLLAQMLDNENRGVLVRMMRVLGIDPPEDWNDLLPL